MNLGFRLRLQSQSSVESSRLSSPTPRHRDTEAVSRESLGASGSRCGTGITLSGGSPATRRSTITCWPLRWPFLRSAVRSRRTCRRKDCRAARSSPPWCSSSRRRSFGSATMSTRATTESYGLTTLRNRHVNVSRSRLRFRFKGKSGKSHDVAFDDVRLARIVRRCQDLPGHELFGYVDDEGNVQDIGSADVNDYLREVTGRDFTAKSFRTWAATVLAACAFQEMPEFRSATHAKRNVVKAVEAVSGLLGNTPAICRKSYIHP